MHRTKRLTSCPLLMAVMSAAGCAAPALAERGTVHQPPALVGEWRAALQFESGAFEPVKDLSFMYVFNDGGTLTESSNYDAAPPVPPAYGIWRMTAPNEYELKYEFFITAPPTRFEDLTTGGGWQPAGRGVFTERLHLAADRKSYESRIHYDVFDKSGAIAAGGGDAKGHGVRLEL